LLGAIDERKEEDVKGCGRRERGYGPRIRQAKTMIPFRIAVLWGTAASRYPIAVDSAMVGSPDLL